MSDSDDAHSNRPPASDARRAHGVDGQPGAVRDAETSLSARIDKFMVDSTPPERPAKADDSTEMYFHGALPDPDELSGLDAFFEREPSREVGVLPEPPVQDRTRDPAATRPVREPPQSRRRPERAMAPTDSRLPDDAAVMRARAAMLAANDAAAQTRPTSANNPDDAFEIGDAVEVTATHQVLPPRAPRPAAEVAQHPIAPPRPVTEPNAQTDLTGAITSATGIAERDDTVPPSYSPEELVADLAPETPALGAETVERAPAKKFAHAGILRRPRSRDANKDS